MSKRDIYIYGAGGLGREILGLVRCLDDWSPAGFFDDRLAQGSLINGLKVLGGGDYIGMLPGQINIVVAIGDPCTRREVILAQSESKINYPTLIHPSAILHDREYITIGAGTIITAGCILTTDISIGEHVLINLNTTIGHDVRIGKFSSIMPGVNLAGAVHVDDSVFIGSGSNILNGVHLGRESKIGMGSVVLRNVESGETVAGVPAKRLHS